MRLNMFHTEMASRYGG